jgi:hypothetical protein
MTGALTLSVDPYEANHAATKQYVDAVREDSAPAGFGYGESIVYKSWSDSDDTALEAWIDANYANEEYHDKTMRISTLVSYPACAVSGNGGYADVQVTSDGSTVLVVGHFYYEGGKTIIATKQKLAGVWYPWEYVNPPMIVGVEYRTTERRNGTTVFKMLGADGVLRYRLEGSAEWLTYAAENGAAPNTLVHKVYDTNTNDVLDAVLEAELRDMPGHSIRHICVSDNVGTTIFFGGMTHITINKVTDEYASVEAVRYHTSGVLMWKRCKYVTWLGWEWVNPPLDTDFEYRTTERYHGYAVIKKMDAAGNILWRAEHETSWRLLSSASVIAPATME